MKKFFLFLSMASIAMMSVTAMAVNTSKSTDEQKSITVEVNAQGKGACRHALCGCKFYVRATGGAGKCVCGHWDYVHN